MNRTQIEEPLSHRGVKDNRSSGIAEMRHSMVEGMASRPAMEGRRDSGSNSIPSSRNFKQNHLLKKVIESSRLISQGNK